MSEKTYTITKGDLLQLVQSNQQILHGYGLLITAMKNGNTDEAVRLLRTEPDQVIQGCKALAAGLDEIVYNKENARP